MKLNALVFILVVALFAGGVQAALVMQIDAANEQFRITGSDSGTPTHGDIYGVLWAIGSSEIEPTVSYEEIAANFLFSESFDFLTGISVVHDADAGEAAAVLIVMSETDFSILSGNAVWVDYSDMDESLKPEFEDMIGGTMSTTADWSDMIIQAGVVPEPATAGLLGISVGALWLFRRLKKTANYYRT